MIFEYLYNLSAAHDFWKNDLRFTRDVFTNAAAEVRREFSINGNHVDVREQLEAYTGNKKPREVFKRFYKNVEFQQLVTAGSKAHNPWKHWVDNNPEASNEFLTSFHKAIHGVMKDGFEVDAAKLAALEVRLKKV